MSREPEVALAFTPDYWVEDIHRHLSDHGGARVRSVVVEPGVAIEESYDVLLAGHRWPALTRALVADVHARGRAVLGVYDPDETASRAHLVGLGVDALIESDASADAFVRSIVSVAGTRGDRTHPQPPEIDVRLGRLVTVGGAPGVGRTEVALQLTAALAARVPSVVLVDADDVAPALAQRLHAPIEPNLAAAIDAVEHGRGVLEECVLAVPGIGGGLVAGIPNPRAWTQTRPGEVMRVIDRLADTADIVVADGAGMLDDVGGSGSRSRYATGRALVREADAVVVVCDASPQGVTRVLGWAAECREIAPATPLVVVANRAPAARFARGELLDEIAHSFPVVDVVCAPYDTRVTTAAWNGTVTRKGEFVRVIDAVAAVAAGLPRRDCEAQVHEVAS
jgi:MinD-like ATPase involved in chromosome partitioning or flagellar assembly